MKKVFFVSDFFLNEISGGAELCNDALINNYLSKNYDIYTVKSVDLTKKIIDDNKDCFFIIANFFLLSDQIKVHLIEQKIKYCIYEHDHKYLKTNNPLRYKNCLANEDQLQNIEFYKNAKAVLCQSKLHSDIVFKNMLLKNIVNLGGNIWSEEHLKILENNIKTEDLKTINNIIYKSENYNKGTEKTIQYCKKNNIEFEFLENSNYPKFIENLSKAKKVYFFPNWIETFSRFAIEAKILNCKIVTDSTLGCASENLLSLSGIELLNEIKNRMKKIYNIFDEIINNKILNFYETNLPRITIMSTFVDGEKYLEQYLDSIVEQSIFSEIDLYLVDANSSGREKDIISKYSKYKNIFYIRLEKKVTISEAFNLVLELTNNQFVSMVQIDDRLFPHYAETLRKHLFFSEGIDLVYGDCLQTNYPNETYKNNSSKGQLYEHSINQFTKENMIKCLPGPMPMFKKSMLEKNGFFNKDLMYANDWELWLRCVRAGSVFKKINSIIGLYFFNPEGNSTSKKNIIKKIKEEKNIFNEYIDIIGQKNYSLYKDYFNGVINE